MATVTSQLTRISDVEGALTFTSIGGGPGASANADVVIQGAQSAARRTSNATDLGFWLTVATQDVSAAGVHVGIWINHLQSSLLTKYAVRLGSTTTNWNEHSYPLAQYADTGGWQRFWIHVDRTPDATAGNFNQAALTQIAVLVSLPAVSGNAQNLFMDASDFTTTGLLLTGTTGLFSDFTAADGGNITNRWGVVILQAGVIYCYARLTLGSATALEFDDSGFIIVFPQQLTVSSTFMGITVDLQNAATVIEWDNGVLRSSDSTRGDLIVSGSNGSFTISNSTLINLRVITLTSTCEFNNTTVIGSGTLTPNSATLDNCNISNSFDTAAIVINSAAEITSITNTTFANNTVAIRITTPGTYNFDNLRFINNTNDIENSSSGDVIINALNGTNVGTFINTGGGSVEIINAKQLVITNIIENTEVRIYRTSDSFELGGVETVTVPPVNASSNITVEADPDNTGRFKLTLAYNYISDIDIYIIALNLNYQWLKLSDRLTSENKSIQINQIIDRQYF